MFEEATLMEFFRQGVEDIQKRRKISLQEMTQFYLVNLLSEFLNAQRLHESKSMEDVDEPLALIYGRAIATADDTLRLQLLKDIGDRTLYISGFFSDSLKRGAVDLDYYMAMGENAYSSVSDLSRDSSRLNPLSDVFEELSFKFIQLVDLISEISEESGMTSDQDLLRLYERWLQTRSKRLYRKLQNEGLIPLDVDREPIH